MKALSKLLLLLLAAALLLTGCKTPIRTDESPTPVPDDYTPAPTATPEPTAVPGEFVVSGEAYKAAAIPNDNNRVFYEIFTGSFSDSNGDGIGDLRGIINRMDYLNDGDPDSGKSLGIEGIWLTPIFDSPSYHKYDVADFYTVDPAFGTTEDLVELVELCHARGVKLILDLPINHTSRRNQWFTTFLKAHRQGDTDSDYYDFYTWYDGDTDRAPAGRSFAQLSGTNHYYEWNFAGGMPELNFDNELVREAVLAVAKYYLGLGVDGFRFDAAKYLYFGDHDSNQDFWIWYIDELKVINPDLYTVAEVWDGDGVTERYYPAMNCFNFTMADKGGLIAEIANRGNVNRYTAYVESYLNKVQTLREDATIVPFIANHDTDRAAGYVTVATGSMQMAANLYLLGPGSPFIYYREELGIRGSRGSATTDANRRLAMVWGDEDTIQDPEGTTYQKKNQISTTAVEQMRTETSLCTYYKKLLMIRRANPEIARGTYEALKADASDLGGFLATYNGSTVLVFHNASMSAKTVDLSTRTDRVIKELRAVIWQEDATLTGTRLVIGAQTSVVIGCE